MPQLKLGSKVPAVTLEDQTGMNRPLAGSADFTVLFFYPKDDTPGCTLEAQQFTKAISKFKKLKAEVVGVSGGTTASKVKFCDKYHLGVTLLSDTDFSVAKEFGAYGEKKFMGRTYLGILRQTFVLDKTGKVIQIFPEVKPEGHADEVLAFLSGKKKTKAVSSAPKTKAKKSSPKSSRPARAASKLVKSKVLKKKR